VHANITINKQLSVSTVSTLFPFIAYGDHEQTYVRRYMCVGDEVIALDFAWNCT
jgi:hypothetical protein